MPIVTQFDFIEKPFVRLHIGPPHRDETYPGLRQHAGFISRAIVGFIAKQSRARRQNDRQFVYRRQIVKGGRHQLKTDWDAVWCADQVQAPAKELLLFGSAVATVFASTHLFTAPRPHAATDGYRQT